MPYKFTQSTTKNEILRHMMTADNSTSHAVNGRIIKADVAWMTLGNSVVNNNINLPTEQRLILFNALIGGILLYIIH